MAVRSRQLGPFTLPVAAAAQYTVPAGRTFILHTLTIYNATGASANFGLAMRSGGTDYYFLRRTAVANSSSEIIAGLEIVFNPGMALVGFCSVAGGGWVTASGTLLDGAPA